MTPTTPPTTPPPTPDATPNPTPPPPRTLALGDPQVTDARLRALLGSRGLLDADGRLAGDVRLLSLGDHFDPHHRDDDSAAAGARLLAWLASHPAEQVRLLLGNHDLVRVQEFIHFTDATFADARATCEASHDDNAKARWLAERHPGVPTPGVVTRDFASYGEAQRDLVIELLLARRLRLAAVVVVFGREVLATHAGVTRRELALLGLPLDAPPRRIAAALDALLDERVARVADAWRAGQRAPLDLSPLHVVGTAGHECGGMLAHRPSHRASARDADWKFDAVRPRRFEPTQLPPGLRQLVGHSGHGHCKRELAPWMDADTNARAWLALRTLTVRGEQVRYAAGLQDAPDDAAVLYLADGELTRVPDEHAQLAPLDGWIAA